MLFKISVPKARLLARFSDTTLISNQRFAHGIGRLRGNRDSQLSAIFERSVIQANNSSYAVASPARNNAVLCLDFSSLVLVSGNQAGDVDVVFDIGDAGIINVADLANFSGSSSVLAGSPSNIDECPRFEGFVGGGA